MLASGDIILELIPQRPPMVMVGKLLACDEKSTTTSLKINENNVFVSRNLFSPSGLLESMAQTAALRTGWLLRNKPGDANKKIPVGVIGSIKNFKLYFMPAAGTEIFTTIIVEYEFGNATLISGNVESGGRLAAEAEMQIFLTETGTDP